MASSNRRTVISGIGIVSPIGLTRADFWQSLEQKKSGVKPITLFDASASPARIAGQVEGFVAKSYTRSRDAVKSLRVMARSIQLAVGAAQLAIDDGKLDVKAINSERFGVEFGASLIATELEEIGDASAVSANCTPGKVDLEKWGEQGLAVIPPLWMLKYLPNMLACHVSILHNAQGPNNTIISGDVASLLALGESIRIIQRNQADVFLAGGGESRLNPLGVARQVLFQPLSRRNDEPERACRPFDRNRDGLVIGEGSSVFIVEDLEHAKNRGATIYAEIVGFGSSFGVDPSGDGLARAMTAALKEANVAPSDIDHINAHGTSVIERDVMESRAIRHVFGDLKVPVFAGKSYLGNMGAGGGITEMAASVLAFHHGKVPASLNYETPDPDCPVNVTTEPRPVQKPYFLKLGFTDMGQCAAVVVKRWTN